MRSKPRVDFIGLGAAKSGTTWITDCLRAHPEIGYPDTNELNYFSRTRANNTKSEYDFRGIQGYLDLFTKCKGKINGEISTHYLPDPKVAPIIKKYFPNIKLIVVLRQPVERAFSDYLNYKLLSLDEKDSFDKAFFKRKKSYYDNYLEKGMYYKQLKLYFDLFSKKNIKVILFDDIKKDPEKVIKDLYKFLGVNSNMIPEAVHKKSNISGVTRIKSFRVLMNYISKATHIMEDIGLGKAISFVKRKTSLNNVYWYLVNTINRKKLNKPKLDSKIKKRLNKSYIEDITKLEKLIKRDLSDWK